MKSLIESHKLEYLVNFFTFYTPLRLSREVKIRTLNGKREELRSDIYP